MDVEPQQPAVGRVAEKRKKEEPADSSSTAPATSVKPKPRKKVKRAPELDWKLLIVPQRRASKKAQKKFIPSQSMMTTEETFVSSRTKRVNGELNCWDCVGRDMNLFCFSSLYLQLLVIFRATYLFYLLSRLHPSPANLPSSTPQSLFQGIASISTISICSVSKV